MLARSFRGKRGRFSNQGTDRAVIMVVLLVVAALALPQPEGRNKTCAVGPSGFLAAREAFIDLGDDNWQLGDSRNHKMRAGVEKTVGSSVKP